MNMDIFDKYLHFHEVMGILELVFTFVQWLFKSLNQSSSHFISKWKCRQELLELFVMF